MSRLCLIAVLLSCVVIANDGPSRTIVFTTTTTPVTTTTTSIIIGNYQVNYRAHTARITMTSCSGGPLSTHLCIAKTYESPLCCSVRVYVLLPLPRQMQVLTRITGSPYITTTASTIIPLPLV